MEYRVKAFYPNRDFSSVMSSRERGAWTSITIRRSVFNRLEDFADAYEISGKGEAIDTLLTIVETAGIPISEDGETPSTEEIDLDSVADIEGFLLKDGGGVALVGTDGSKATVITNVSEAQNPVQPAYRTKITHGSVYCPACGDVIFEYELSESYPGVETGVFNSLRVTCGTCESERPHYTLFIGQAGYSPNPKALKRAIRTYLSYVLIVESLTPEMFEDRIRHCEQLAVDGGWEWLPDPTEWIGFEGPGTDPITAQMYCGFLQSYLRLLVEETTDATVMEFTVSSPESSDGYYGPDWQIEMETRGESPMPGVEELAERTTGWDSVEFDAEELEVNTFADHTVLVTLHGLADVEESELTA